MSIIMHLAAGLVFGLGLIVSGLANPAKVQGFLDIAGAWDPSLAFTMGGAVVVTAIGYTLAFRRSRPFFADRFHVPTAKDIDAPLVTGAALFGVGWGLAGYCPGPAIVALTFANPGTIAFVIAMLAGMAVRRLGTAAQLTPVK